MHTIAVDHIAMNNNGTMSFGKMDPCSRRKNGSFECLA